MEDNLAPPKTQTQFNTRVFEPICFNFALDKAAGALEPEIGFTQEEEAWVHELTHALSWKC